MTQPTTNNQQPTTGLKFLLVLLLVVGCWWWVGAPSADAQLTEYAMLEPLPGVTIAEGSASTTAASYIPGIFRLTLAIAGVLAVLRLIYAGILYMSSDAYSNTNEAKGIINDALWGLALVLGAWMIVATLFDNEGENLNLSLDIPRQQLPPNQNVPIEIGMPPGPGSGLTQAQAMRILQDANIIINGPIVLAGIQQRTINELLALKSACGPNCEVRVTSATGGAHAPGACSHSAGYKADLRLTPTLTRHIEDNYLRLPTRSDGAIMYQSPSGAKYAKESNHWDMVVTCP